MKKRIFLTVLTIIVTLMLITGCGCTLIRDNMAARREAEAQASLLVAKESYDLVIIGGGGAGMTAALQAKEAGVEVVILEKMPEMGGNTIKSSSGMNASETKYQKEQNIEDSNDKFFEETLEGGKGTNDQALLRFFVDHSAETIDWLAEKGIILDNITITGGMTVKRTHRPSDGSGVGPFLVSELMKQIDANQIPIFVNADVKSIIKDGDEVTGVNVSFNGEAEKPIKAKAVIVASGGFGANQEMVIKYKPELKGYVTTNQKGTTGDGIKMVEEIGGAVIALDQIQIHPTVEQETSFLIGESLRGEGGILVDQTGKRFINELETRDVVSAAIIELSEQYAYLVLDSGVKERAKALEFYISKGFVVEGESVEALAKNLNIPEVELKTTIETWNQNVATKTDAEFSRTTGMEHDLSKDPYYAIKIAPGIHHTMGGVKVNVNSEVLTPDGSIIKGLYAAGEVTGGLHGNNRIGGNAIADIEIFGRRAGSQAAEFVKAK